MGREKGKRSVSGGLEKKVFHINGYRRLRVVGAT